VAFDGGFKALGMITLFKPLAYAVFLDLLLILTCVLLLLFRCYHWTVVKLFVFSHLIELLFNPLLFAFAVHTFAVLLGLFYI
jgi:hypothetical protein